MRLLFLLPVVSTAWVLPVRNHRATTTLASSTTDDFASFAASLEEDTRSTTVTTKDPMIKNKSWQEDLDEFLNPMTPAARKQVLLSDLAGANSEIQASIQSALRDGTIDPLLTPRGKRLQEGTRAVARQVVSDILPSLAISFPPPSVSQGLFPPPPFPFPPAEDINRLGTRVFNALQNQIQTGFKNLQEDLQDPTTRIPQRLSQQTEEILQEAANVFSETPAGLKEPPYQVVATTEAYEIRDYEGYTVAITNMMMTGTDDPYFTPNTNNLGEQGRAFNSLAAYLFGANRQKEVLDMTTPVTTTMSGEMRFYIDSNNPPDPLEQDESKNVYETDTIRIEEIPPARLAVRRFYGFVTQGEVARQKEALLTALALDGDYELDVPHGQTVKHLIFQYNPPYTIPVVRRNEIAVPISRVSEIETPESADRISENWISPSDGESES
ncbi:hypothetical protein FisN_9Hh248 [Fistulifera solaris]|uniref:Uncharacterized protein n=1 Tax=Fistulifera solaris TaxID=1519565 RepID=A0A1Z5JAZ7_FISSO|nr:hypothetical protein FisN_9Hh248 [Fistulifera solaris]|eukprot:GAX11155.1 hypothetical protein FisN_9Hh248 [Fistulifera solaris]